MNDPTIKPEDIEQYLLANPDFFLEHDDVLATLRIPHTSGKAISLVERQLDVLRERNGELHQRLSGLIDNARENDRLFTHTRRLILALLDCKNLSQAIDIIQSSFANDFGVEKTAILLFSQNSISRARSVSLAEAHHHLGRYLKARQTIGGGLADTEKTYIFENDAENIGSAALAVLAYGDVYGIIAIGNHDPKYYNSSMGTLFLSYIAEVLSRVLRRFIEE